MASEYSDRRLAAIMFTDIVGYTALMAASEERALAARENHRALVQPLVEQYHGRSIEVRGDECLSLFQSALDAVNCALAIQGKLADDDLALHIGIHVGDVLQQGPEISGDGVNIAARLCSLSGPNAACISAEVYQTVRNQPNIRATPLGERELKNVGRPVSVFSVSGTAVAPRPLSEPHVQRGLRAASWIGSALVLLAVAGGGWWLGQTTDDVSGIRSIAVLPLENLSGDPEQAYFAAGMTEALIGDLARIASLQVISRTSVLRYQETDKSLPEIARELGVDAILEGTVLRDGDRVRITAQLIDARSDHHLWAQSYDRLLRDVLTLQAEVARHVAGEIELELTPADQARLAYRPSVDPAAHDAYLRGRVLFANGTHDAMLKAIAYFEESIRIDPDYARGYAGLADAYS